MIVLDTNVLSEVLRPAPDTGVLNWLGSQTRSSVFTTTVTRGELFYGVHLQPDGQRRRQLLETLSRAWFYPELRRRDKGHATEAARFHSG